MPDQLTVTFPYSPIDHADALAESPRLQRVRRWWLLTGVALVGLIAVVALARRPAGESLTYSLGLFALLLPVPGFWFIMPPLQKRFQVSQFRRVREADDSTTETRTFGSDGFTPSTAWAQPIPWSLVTLVSESDRFFLISHAGSVHPVYVPKHALSESDASRLRQLLQNEFRLRPNDLQLHAGAT